MLLSRLSVLVACLLLALPAAAAAQDRTAAQAQYEAASPGTSPTLDDDDDDGGPGGPGAPDAGAVPGAGGTSPAAAQTVAGDGSSLPFTGLGLVPLAGAGLLLLAAGLALAQRVRSR